MIWNILTGQRSPKTPLDRAEKAIASGDREALGQAMADLSLLVPNNRHLVQPLLIVATHLARDGHNPGRAVDAVTVAATFAPRDSVLEREATKLWEKYVEALPESMQRVKAAKLAEAFALPVSLFELQAGRVRERAVETLGTAMAGTAAGHVARAYVLPNSSCERQPVAAWERQVTALPPLQRIEAVALAAAYARTGSRPEHYAVETLVRHVHEAPELVRRIEVAKMAVAFASRGSELERSAVSVWSTQTAALQAQLRRGIATTMEPGFAWSIPGSVARPSQPHLRQGVDQTAQEVPTRYAANRFVRRSFRRRDAKLTA